MAGYRDRVAGRECLFESFVQHGFDVIGVPIPRGLGMLLLVCHHHHLDIGGSQEKTRLGSGPNSQGWRCRSAT